MSKSIIVDICPNCGADSLRGEAKIDMWISYSNDSFKHFYYEDCGNDPIVDSWYCFDCGETFNRQEIEEQAEKLLNSVKENNEN